MKKVVIIQRIVPHYRLSFFDKLQKTLRDRGIVLQLLYGQERSGTVPKSETIDKPWAIRQRNYYFDCFGSTAVYQPCLKKTRDADLVIVEQASSLLLNYLLMLQRKLFGKRVAFWGHGVNVRATNPNSLSERLKAALIREVDWWFAYTRHTLRVLESNNFPSVRTTLVQNAIDNEPFRDAINRLSDRDMTEVRADLGLKGSPIGLYCGGFIPPKRLGVFVDICLQLRSRFPSFEVIIIGSGPEQAVITEFASEHSWAHYVGPKFDVDRAPYFRVSDFMIQPGTVGLVVIDSFISEVPLFTTKLSEHAPEIEFLENEANGFVVEDDVIAFVNGVASYLECTRLQERIKAGCRESAASLTLDSMVENFATGIESALNRRR